MSACLFAEVVILRTKHTTCVYVRLVCVASVAKTEFSDCVKPIQIFVFSDFARLGATVSGHGSTPSSERARGRCAAVACGFLSPCASVETRLYAKLIAASICDTYVFVW